MVRGSDDIIKTDLETLAALEQTARAFDAEIDAALPAIRRLIDAGYAGADWVEVALQNADMPAALAQAIEDLRVADGDLGASLWLVYDRGKKELREVLQELAYRDDAEARIVAYMGYRKRIRDQERPAE